MNNTDFYAVRPDLVLNAARCFNIRVSILESGARTLFNKAIAIDAGKEQARWGRHQCAVIKQFCEYTASDDTGTTLPWQELVEDAMNYDGQEGISPRTGNRPLATVERCAIDAPALRDARLERGWEPAELAERCGLPLRFLQAIEDGEWKEVARSTADTIAAALDVPVATILVTDSAADTTDQSAPERPGFLPFVAFLQRPVTSATLATVLVLAVVFTGWWQWQDNASASPLADALIDSQWHMSVELINKNIPVPEAEIERWRNGGFIRLEGDHGIAFNWIDANALVRLPDGVNWQADEHQLVLKLDKVIYKFDIQTLGDTHTTLDTTRSFEMTLHRLYL